METELYFRIWQTSRLFEYGFKNIALLCYMRTQNAFF